MRNTDSCVCVFNTEIRKKKKPGRDWEHYRLDTVNVLPFTLHNIFYDNLAV